MRKYIGKGAFIPGVPARDLTEDEWEQHVKAGRVTEKTPLYEKAGERGKAKEEVTGDANR